MSYTEPSKYVKNIHAIKGMKNFTMDSRKLTIGSSEIGEILHCVVCPKLKTKPKNQTEYSDRIPKKVLRSKLLGSPNTWATTFGNVYEDTTQKIFQMLFRCEVLNPDVSRTSIHVGPYNSCSADGITTLQLPKEFVRDAYKKSQRLYEDLMTSYEVKFPFLIDNNLFEKWKSDEEQMEVDVLCEFKSTFSRKLDKKMKPGYVCQVLSGMDILRLDHGILTETEIKLCLKEQFDFSRKIFSKCELLDWDSDPMMLGCKIYMKLNCDNRVHIMDDDYFDYDSDRFRFMNSLKVGEDYTTIDLPTFVKTEHGFTLYNFWCPFDEAKLFLMQMEDMFDTETLEFSMDDFEKISCMYFEMVQEIMCKDDAFCVQPWKLMKCRSSYYPRMEGFCKYLEKQSSKVLEFVAGNPSVGAIENFTF